MREDICHTYDPRSSESDLVARRCVTKHRSPCCRCSAAQPCLTLCDPVDSSIPGSSVRHRLPGFAQIHSAFETVTFCPASQQGSGRGWGFWCWVTPTSGLGAPRVESGGCRPGYPHPACWSPASQLELEGRDRRQLSLERRRHDLWNISRSPKDE